MDKSLMVEQLVNYYTSGNKAKFAAKLGIHAQNISAWIARNTFDAELIYANCEHVNADWLLSGVGEMLKTSITNHGNIVVGDRNKVGDMKTETTTNNTTNNYGECCGNGKPSQIVATLTESVATLTRELETSQQQKSNLIKIIDKLTNK